MLRKLLIVQWSGDLPAWTDKWLRNTSRVGSGFEFMLDTDTAGIRSRIEALGVTPPVLSGRKLCDYRPALGAMYAAELEGFDFWGHTDLDCVYGRVGEYVTDSLLAGCDVFSNDRAPFMCGPFSLYRNTPIVNGAFREHDGWQAIFEDSRYHGFDERPIGRTIRRLGLRAEHRHWHGPDSMYLHFRQPKVYPAVPESFLPVAA